MQGGLVLSEAVKQSGILELVATFITNSTENLDLWSLVAVFCAVVAICTTFISHTVGAMVILPVVQTVGNALPVPHPRLMVMANVLMCSGAMGLPVSGMLPPLRSDATCVSASVGRRSIIEPTRTRRV